MLNQKFHPAFGYVLVRNTVDPEVEYVTEINPTSSSRLFYVKGFLEFYLDQSLVYTTREGTVEESASHNYARYRTIASPEGCEFFCLDPKINRGALPSTRFDILNPGQTLELTANTKFYLCRGEIKIDGTTLSGPKQIFVRSEVKTVEAVTKCFAIVFL